MLRFFSVGLFGRIARFARSRDGNVAMLFSLSLVPIMGAAGIAIDYGRIRSEKVILQQATDASALATLKARVETPSISLQRVAQQNFNAAYRWRSGGVEPVSASYDAKANTVTVTARATVPSYIMKFFHEPTMRAAARSTAAYVAGTGQKWPVCVLIVADTEVHTLMTSQSAKFDFKDCMVQVNTTNWDAVEARDSSYIHSIKGENCFVGEIHHGDVTPEKNPSCTMFPDPFAGKPMPAASQTCTFTNKTVTSDETLTPGTYCGDTNIVGGKVQMSSGVYYIRDGNFTVGGSADVNAHGVNIVLTGNGPNFYVKDTATFRQIAMRSGKFNGFALYLDNNSSVSACSGFTNGDKVSKAGIDNPPPGKKPAPAQASSAGLQNCINAVYGNAYASITGVIYTANAAFVAADNAMVEVNGSFVSKFLVGTDNAWFRLTGAVPSWSAAAAIMQKNSESSSAQPTLRLIN